MKSHDSRIISIQIMARAITASTIGNILEWFDFAVYGFMAIYIGPLFFNNQDKVSSLLSAFAVFAIGYVARPIGAIVLGYLGDKYGRKFLLVFSMLLLGFASFAIGLLPTYAQIGNWAPFLLIVLRLIQGFSIGGEYTGSMIYTSELAYQKHRGFISSFSTAGTMVGILLSSAVVWLSVRFIGEENMNIWGWRIPFLVGVLISFVGFYLRAHLPETFIPAENNSISGISQENNMYSSIKYALTSHWKDLIKIIGIVTGSNIALYIFFVFVVDVVNLQQKGVNVQAYNTLGLAITIPFTLIGGWLSDRFGRKFVSVQSNIGILLLSLPVLIMCLDFDLWPFKLPMPMPELFLIGQIMMAIPIGLVLGVQGAMIAEILPKDVRCTIFSLAYSLAMGLFAGTSPMLAQWMLANGYSMGPAIYIISWTIFALYSLSLVPETVGKKIL